MKRNRNYHLSDFSFDLPDSLIAQHPEDRRDEARLFVVDRRRNEFDHRRFYELKEYLRAGDVLVFNDARVMPARIYLKRDTGGKVEIILSRHVAGRNWLVICNRTKRLSMGETLTAERDEHVTMSILRRDGDYLEVAFSEELNEVVLNRIGNVPLPPYIRREFTGLDRERYQTVYAAKTGSAAAPTAGFHFTESLLGSFRAMGVETVNLTLDVSWGTFQPVRDEDLSLHRMHSEAYDLPDNTALAINRARKEGRRVVAVGTTSLRVLESTYADGKNHYGKGETDLFIYPPRAVHSADVLITNFHTPRSTLLMLVSAFGGYECIMKAYAEAVEKRYRFFSYGDAMIIV